MGEWKRVFLDLKRIVFLLLLALMSTGMFMFSLLDYIEPHAFQSVFQAAGYAARTIESWKEIPLEELPEIYAADEARIYAYGRWVNPLIENESLFSGDEEADATVADIPYLIESTSDIYTFELARLTLWKWQNYINEEITYLNSYKAYLDGIQSQAERQSAVGLFNKSGSFTSDNIKKTAYDFDKLYNVQVEFGNNIGVERWLEFRFADYIFLLSIIVIVFAFLEERKKGLWSVVHSCRKGRLSLGINRICILYAASALNAALIYGLPLVISLSINGGWQDLGRSIQSLESFRSCTVLTTISDWILRYFLLKTASGALIGLLLWCVLGSISNIQYSFTVIGAVLAGEYLIYTLLPVNSFLNIIKYINIFSYVHSSDLYTNYQNINLMGSAVGLRSFMFIALPIATIVFAVWTLIIQVKRHPEGNRDILSKLFITLDRAFDYLCAKLTIGGWEIYKTLILESVFLFMIVVLYLSRSMTFVTRSADERDIWYQQYLSDMEGPLDETSDNYFVRARENIHSGMSEFELNQSLDRLESDVAKIKAAAAKDGYEPWLVDGKVYDATYGSTARNRQRLNAWIAIIYLIFCCVGITAFERQSKVVLMLRSLKRGRKALFLRKVLVSAATAVFVWVVVYMNELRVFLDYSKGKTLAAPVQNISALSQFPPGVTFELYLVILYAIRLIMLIFMAFVILLISSYVSNIQTAYILSILLLGFPALLVVLGVDALKYVSPLVPVSSAELMWMLGGGKLTAIAPWMIWTIIGIMAFLLSKRKWVK